MQFLDARLASGQTLHFDRENILEGRDDLVDRIIPWPYLANLPDLEFGVRIKNLVERQAPQLKQNFVFGF